MMLRQLKWKMLWMLLTLMTAVVWFVPQVAEAAYAEPTKYDLWIGGEQVTSENCDNLSGTGWKFDPASNTLLFRNYTCGSGGHLSDNNHVFAHIYSGLKNDLTIRLFGRNRIINRASYPNYHYGICAEKNVVILGDGSLDVEIDSGTYGCAGIKTYGNLTISGTCSVKTSSGLSDNWSNYSDGIECSGILTFQEGCTVECIGGYSANSSTGIDGAKGILFYGGRVKAVGGDGESDSRGIFSGTNMIISPQNDILEIEASGKTEAIRGYVENRIPGIGWDNNQCKETIPAVTEKRMFDSKYLKVQFIAHTHNYAAVWSCDATSHWHACTSTAGICEAPKKDEANHSYGETGDARFTCTVCGYVDTVRKSKAEETDRIAKEAADRIAREAQDRAAKEAAEKAAEEAEQAKAETITIKKTPTGVKAKAKKNKITVTWKKIKKTKKTREILSKIKSIQVQVARDSKFKNIAANKKVGKNKTKAVLKLKRKTTYYVRVRYVGKKGYSKWSKRKRVKTK